MYVGLKSLSKDMDVTMLIRMLLTASEAYGGLIEDNKV